MVKVIRQGVYFMDGRLVKESQAFMTSDKKDAAIKNTITYGILSAHNSGTEENLALKADALICHSLDDLIRTAEFCGLEEFPVPTYLFSADYNADFYRSAAKKYGGDFIPYDFWSRTNYVLEKVVKSGQLLLGNHISRCGALGALGIYGLEGEQLRLLFKETYNLHRPEVIAVQLKGKLKKGVPSSDVIYAIQQAVGRYAEDKILEFFGAGLAHLSMEDRSTIDKALPLLVSCFSTVWTTDDKTKKYFELHDRGEDFKPLAPAQPAYYDGAITVDLSKIEPLESRVYHGIGKPQKVPLAYGEEIKPLPEFPPLPANLLLSIGEPDEKQIQNRFGALPEGVEIKELVLIEDDDDYYWSKAIEFREYGMVATLQKSYTDKYRTHLLDWGILPLSADKIELKEGDIVYLEHIADHIKAGEERIVAKVFGKRKVRDIVLALGKLTEEEKTVLLAGGRNNLIRKK